MERYAEKYEQAKEQRDENAAMALISEVAEEMLKGQAEWDHRKRRRPEDPMPERVPDDGYRPGTMDKERRVVNYKGRRAELEQQPYNEARAAKLLKSTKACEE